MTARAGSSDVFWGAAVVYADAAKTRLLGVDPGVIAAHGAVSGPVALAMAAGLYRLSATPLGVSVTGVAGPSGGSPEKPVGTVWFGLTGVREGRASAVAVVHRFDGTRASIQAQTARWARVLARQWWESDLELDSLRSLADNDGKPFVLAFELPQPLPSNSF
jgi:nicotinamide-nucleotide amidase